jgi:hypothetical protein
MAMAYSTITCFQLVPVLMVRGAKKIITQEQQGNNKESTSPNGYCCNSKDYVAATAA